MSSNISTSATDLAHLQIQFISSDEKFLSNLPNEIVNVPITSEPEQLNLLVNKISESANENWTPINFDFLIDSILLRTSLFEFIENYKLSLENVLKIECIVQTPAPKPEHDSKDTEWVASLKILDQNCVLSVNYGGQFSVWSGSKKFEKILTEQLDEDPMKCLDIFWKEKELFALIGAQNQTIILAKIKWKENGEEKQNFKFIPQSILRGHQRSVECLAANKQGTRAISGSFDKCMKVWNIEEIDPIDDDEQQSHSTGEKRSKRMRIESKLPTKTPMVTLEAHREAVVDLCWDPLNAGRAVSVSWDHQILIWDLELAGPIANLTSNKAFTSLALNPFNGLVLTGSTDPLVRMWDSKSKEGSMVKNTYSGHLGWVADLCWSPSNENLFASASFDKTVKMWDIRSPKAALYDLMGHEDRVLCVDWSQSGRIASGSADSTLKVFSCR